MSFGKVNLLPREELEAGLRRRHHTYNPKGEKKLKSRSPGETLVVSGAVRAPAGTSSAYSKRTASSRSWPFVSETLMKLSLEVRDS